MTETQSDQAREKAREEAREEAREAPRWRGVLQLAVIAAVILAAIFLARAPRQEFLELDSSASQLSVEPTAAVMQASATSAAHSVALTGTVTTLGTVQVTPEASGEVVFVSERFRSGAAFGAGETLLRIDTTEYDIALAAARADLAFAEAHLREVRDRHGRSAEFFARSPDGTVHPWPALDGAIEKAEALLESARLKVRLAEVQLDQTRIRMPFDGYVTSTAISVGQVVTGRTSSVGGVFAKHELRVAAQVSTFDLNSLQPVIGRAAAVVADGRAYRGEVERVSSMVDLETRLASLYLRLLDQETLELLPPPGTFVDVTVAGPLREDVFVLPEATMQMNGSVWLVDNRELVSFTPASLGYRDDAWIVNAFDTRDGIVVGSVAGAREGLSVNPVPAADP